MAVFKIFGRKKRRKYPVKVDEEGRSARSRCFEMFAEKIPLQDVAKKADVKVDTVRRYHQQWKKDPGLERRYAYVKSLFNKTAQDRDKNVDLFARACGIEKEMLETILSQPHGLRRLMTGKFYFPAPADADHKRHVALEMALLISDHLIKNGGKFWDVYIAFERYMQENKKYREEKEENRITTLMHRILAKDIENERRGWVELDRLSEDERLAIIMSGIKVIGNEKSTKIVLLPSWFSNGRGVNRGASTRKNVSGPAQER